MQIQELHPLAVQIINIGFGLIVAWSAYASARAAISALNQWKSELLGKERFALARNMVLTANQFRDEFRKAVMGPPTPAEYSANTFDVEVARRERLIPLNDILSKLDTLGWEAEFILSPDAAKLVVPFRRAQQEQLTSLQRYVLYMQQAGQPHRQQFIATEDQFAELENIVFGFSEEGPVFNMINNAVDELKSGLVQYVA